jgi:diaminohydroxyphosphoribosylaminopyrimidine deaminase / 5-amino-6-(5-phosphoribosylamino)uracil reductase
MRRAIDLGLNGRGLAPPNPMVGAVVVRDGNIVGEGWHEGPGTPHAEVRALRAAGDRAKGATLYVTLEPCSHHGRTPPCAPAVRDAGVARVVAGMRDPNPAVDGGGVAILRAAGVEVEEGTLGPEVEELVAGFARHILTGFPLVTLKMAASLDGRTAASDGSSRWISGEAARQDAHGLRSRAGAVVVGAGTAIVDDPSLTVRLGGYRGRQPVRVLVDSRGRTPASRAMFDAAAPTLVATTPHAPAAARAAWAAAGAEVALFEAARSGGVSLPALVVALGKREIQDVLIEGGPTLAWAALEAGVVDRLVMYLAPKLIGGAAAPGVLSGAGVATIADAVPIELTSVEEIGGDLKVVAVVHRDR